MRKIGLFLIVVFSSCAWAANPRGLIEFWRNAKLAARLLPPSKARAFFPYLVGRNVWQIEKLSPAMQQKLRVELLEKFNAQAREQIISLDPERPEEQISVETAENIYALIAKPDNPFVREVESKKAYILSIIGGENDIDVFRHNFSPDGWALPSPTKSIERIFQVSDNIAETQVVVVGETKILKVPSHALPNEDKVREWLVGHFMDPSPGYRSKVYSSMGKFLLTNGTVLFVAPALILTSFVTVCDADLIDIYPHKIKSFDGESSFDIGKLRRVSAYYNLALVEINGEHPDYTSINASPPTSLIGLNALGFTKGGIFKEVPALEEYTYENYTDDFSSTHREDFFGFTVDHEHPSREFIRSGNFVVDKLGHIVGMVNELTANYLPQVGETITAHVLSPFWIREFLEGRVGLDCSSFPSNTDCLQAEWKRVNEAIYNREKPHRYPLVMANRFDQIRKHEAATFWIYVGVHHGGHPLMKYVLANRYANGLGTDRDPTKAFLLYKEAAEEDNDARSQIQLGMCYLRGIGTEIDLPLAFYWISKGMEKVKVSPDIPKLIFDTLLVHLGHIEGGLEYFRKFHTLFYP